MARLDQLFKPDTDRRRSPTRQGSLAQPAARAAPRDGRDDARMRRRYAVAVLAALAIGGCAERFLQPAPAEVPSMPLNAVYPADGADLPLRSFLPAGAPRAAIVAVHGFNDYSNAFS